MTEYTVTENVDVSYYTAKQLRYLIDEKIEEFGENNVEFSCELVSNYGSDYAKAYVCWTRPMTELEREAADADKKQREESHRKWQLQQYGYLKKQLGL